MKSIFVIEHDGEPIDKDKVGIIEMFLHNIIRGNVLVCSHINQNSKSDLVIPNAFPDGATFAIPVALQGMKDLKKAKMKVSKRDE